jgi:hypothetical protein
MEGEYSSAGLLLVKYVSIKDFLKKRMNNVTEPEFKAMLRKMIEKTKTYLHEVLVCDLGILATILNPSFWLSIFQACFSSHYDYAKALLRQKYTNRKDKLVANINLKEPSPPVASQPQPTDHHRPIDSMVLLPESIEASVSNELAIYLGGKYRSLPAQAGQCLQWWKVSETKIFSTINISCMDLRLIQLLFTLNQEHHNKFPVLAPLACSATSASVERCFSAAADVCGPNRGRLSIQTIERSVSSHQWLKQGFKGDDEFQIAQDIVSQDLMEEEESKTKCATA